MISIESFGKNIRRKREKLEISQYELAERLDISPNHLSSLETGKTKPSFNLLCKLCVELNVPPNYLMLGSIHSNNIPQNIVDKLKLCSDLLFSAAFMWFVDILPLPINAYFIFASSYIPQSFL